MEEFPSVEEKAVSKKSCEHTRAHLLTTGNSVMLHSKELLVCPSIAPSSFKGTRKIHRFQF
jgi:hypothetical protein